jgi:hypothetical protein
LFGEEMRDLTCIYYTHNKERPEFEARIQHTLLHQLRKTGVHLISVSQKPMDFGHNICVGDVGISGHNTWRQFQIGVEAAKTRYVCTAESDYLHPREYFQFECPTDDTMYIMHPLWVLFAQKGGRYVFAPKAESSEAIMHGGRDFILSILESMFNKRIYDKEDFWAKADKRHNLPYLFKQGKCEHVTLPSPLITFKTDENMHRKTRTSMRLRTDVLPPWGSALGLIRKYCR